MDAETQKKLVKHWQKIGGGYLREISVLMLVFGLLDSVQKRVEGTKNLFSDWQSLAWFFFFVLVFFIAGGILEWKSSK